MYHRQTHTVTLAFRAGKQKGVAGVSTCINTVNDHSRSACL